MVSCSSPQDDSVSTCKAHALGGIFILFSQKGRGTVIGTVLRDFNEHLNQPKSRPTC